VSTTVLSGTRSAALQSVAGVNKMAREAKYIKNLGQAYRTADVTPDPDLQVRGMLTGSPDEFTRETYLITDHADE
jgi:hypothetical protein